MKRLINLSQHPMTEEQKVGFDDVIEISSQHRMFLNVIDPPTTYERCIELANRAVQLCNIAGVSKGDTVHVAGQSHLTALLIQRVFFLQATPVYAFTRRETREDRKPDGSVVKTSMFAHVAWVPYLDETEARELLDEVIIDDGN